MKTHHKVLIGVAILGFVLWALGKVAALYADYLWFNALGFAGVFTKMLWSQVWLGVAAFLVTGAWLGANVYLAARLSPGRRFYLGELQAWLTPQRLRLCLRVGSALVILAVAFGFGKGLSGYWFEVLEYRNRVPFGWTDPILNYDAGFYTFVLPILNKVQNYVLAMAALGLVAAGAAYFIGGAIGTQYIRMTRAATRHLAALGAVLFAAVAFGYWLDRFVLMLSSRGVVFGVGHVDDHARIPVLGAMVVVSLVTAVLVLAAGLAQRRVFAIAGVALLVAAHVLAAKGYPLALQRFSVQPNELKLEGPYLAHNIAATRFAFGLEDVEVREYSATGDLTPADIEEAHGTIGNVRLWDWRVLKATFRELQGLRTYYRFDDVDVDRYRIEGQYRQVSLAVRELDQQSLQPQSRTWVNLHLLYTHGYGVCMSPVNSVTASGLPVLWIGDIPPKTAEGVPTARSAIYFGELTHNYVFVRTRQQEFDYPLGDKNQYTTFKAETGVPVYSLGRKLLFAYYFRDFNIVLTDSFTPETRVLWRRHIHARVRRLAPFLEFDREAYPVISEGRIVWILDGYTKTRLFPYSAPVGQDDPRMRRRDGRLNYIRNAVKAVVDAYDGTVTFYVSDPEDPLIRVACKIFPSLFRKIQQMPEDLRAHRRYPVDLFEIQARQMMVYHMTDPKVFYNKEDLWERPREVYEGQTQPVASYYIVMTLPGETAPEYLLMLPFTPARKNNMVGWMAGRCDGPNYGKPVVFKFPKDRLIQGPSQIEAMIDKREEISQQLTLWNQLGSRVIRGNLLVIPIRDSILYVEPLYLDSEQTQFPELKRVIVATKDRVAMRATLEEALAAVFGEVPVVKPTPERPAEVPTEAGKPLAALANELLEKAQRQMRDGDWAGYGKTMEALSEVIRKMLPPPAPAPK